LFFFAEKWTIIRDPEHSGAKRKRTMPTTQDSIGLLRLANDDFQSVSGIDERRSALPANATVAFFSSFTSFQPHQGGINE
jgi:hypothetical protein